MIYQDDMEGKPDFHRPEVDSSWFPRALSTASYFYDNFRVSSRRCLPVEVKGIEPLTSDLQSLRSPS